DLAAEEDQGRPHRGVRGWAARTRRNDAARGDERPACALTSADRLSCARSGTGVTTLVRETRGAAIHSAWAQGQLPTAPAGDARSRRWTLSAAGRLREHDGPARQRASGRARISASR